jgi:alpha-D-xyloside xylohydrolase
MRFFDGNWLLREGVTPHFAREVYDARIDGGEVALYCPDRPVADRAGTVDGALLTIRLSSPAPDVVRVRITHHEGGRERRPAFALASGGASVAEVSGGGPAARGTGESGIVLKSGDLEARVGPEAPYLLEFSGGGRRLASTGDRKTAWLSVEGEGNFVMEQLSLGVGERIYGLGERFTPFVRNGQTVDMWNEDGGTSSDQSYKNIPFYLSSAGYGLLVNHPGRVSFEVGTERVARIQFSVPGEELEYFLIYGPSPKETLRKYAALTGLPALPPAWSFGLWLTTSFTTSYDEGTVMGFVKGMAERSLPLRVFHFDCFWMREYHLCDLEWDRRAFPDPKGMLARLKKMGVKVCLWINPYIAQRSSMFEEGKAKGYLLMRESGDVWQWDRWQAGMALVDFTNPEARDWYAGKLEALVDLGVDSFKTDFGERIPTDVRWFDGSDPVRMHNYYTLMYNELVFGLLEKKLGKGAAVVFARSATVGGQKYPVHWGGDCSASFESMAESLRGGLSLSLSGFGFWSHDIGGFEDRASSAVYKRWIAFGLLSSHSRLHGSKEYKVPWLYGEEAVDTLRLFTKLKCRLMPCLYAAAAEASETGAPMMRAMALEFPEDEACGYLDRQYLLGPSLLVAPVFSESGEVSFYLPEGRWTRIIQVDGATADSGAATAASRAASAAVPGAPGEAGEVVEGGRWIRERHGFLSLPLFARPNSIIPFGAVDDLPDYDYAAGVAFHVFEPAEGASAEAAVTDLEGRTVLSCRTELRGGSLSIAVSGRAGFAGRAAIVLRGRAAAKLADGRACERTELGAVFELATGESVRVELE